MSSTIWTRCARRSEPWAGRALRVVESQSQVSTLKLVDTLDEQELLEQLLDDAKPPLLPGTERLHWLLASPFRYPPLPHGSRFGSRLAHGLWYGALDVRTAFAEVAYYVLRFRADMLAGAPDGQLRRTSYRVRLASDRAVDLTAPPYDAFADDVSDPTSHTVGQALGEAMVEDGVGLALFRSARRAKGTNVVVFDPAAFASDPGGFQEWVLTCVGDRVTVSAHGLVAKAKPMQWSRADFEVEGELPAP